MAPCTITKIAIKGVYGEADYNYGAGSNLNEGAWENYSSSTRDYSLTADFSVSATDQNKVINSGKYTFMLLPQIVPEDAVLEITVNDGVEHVLMASIEGSEWKMGYSITYFLTTSVVDDDYVLALSSSNTEISSTGGSASFSIRSYKQTFYGSQVAVPWTLEYSYEDDVLGASEWYNTTTDVVTSATFSGNGSITGESKNAQVVEQIARKKPWRSIHTTTLRSAAQQGSESSPADLSAGKRTANCYVVSAPGYYKFPLVYGNARNADGTANTIAYSSETFVDHNGVHITSPYIYETNGGANVPANAIIVWQDAPHLITPSSVKLSSDHHYIEFLVEQKNICQGNSVLAVCDANGTIMWSWHIWVTDHDITNTIEVHNNPDAGGTVISNFMKVPLGYCDEEVLVRDRRNFTFKVIQPEAGGKTATITFEQLSADSLCTYGCNAPYYQFGRKDPMLPSDGTSNNVDKPYYDNQRDWLRINSSASTAQSIQAPFTFYYIRDQDWSSSHNWDYWNINFTSAASVNNTPTIKTIYDPSVSGFCLPRTAAFTGFTRNGNNTNSTGDFNISGEFSRGLNFYTNGWQSGGTIFLRTFGYRSVYSGSAYGTGAILSVIYNSYLYTSGAYSEYNARLFLFFKESSSFYVKPQETAARGYAYPIIPVAE